MAQYDFKVADYERIFRKRYKIVVLTVLLAVGFSVLFAKMKRPVYQATATVKVDRTTVMGLRMEAVMYGVWDNIETQTKVITSYPVLLRTAKRLGRIPQDIPEDSHPSNERVLAVLERLRGMISTSISSGTNIIRISVRAGKPGLARDVANKTAFAYKEFSIDGKRQNATQTKEFVESQLKRCRADLAEAEGAVRQFEESQKIPSIDANVSRTIDEASRIDKELRKVNGAMMVIEAQRKRLRRRYEGKTTHLVVDTARQKGNAATDRMAWIADFTDRDPGLSRLNTRLIVLQMEREDQLAYYKPDHPAIESIEEKIRETIEEILVHYDSKLAELADQREQLLVEKQEVEGELRLLPANQMRYARLKRRLQVKEELNTMLTTRLQEALIAEAGVVDDVTIMSLATVPGAPINKNVTRVAGVGVFLGLIFGIIFAVIREMFDTSIGTIEDVERTLKLAVLAVIPHIAFGDQKRRHSAGGKKEESGASSHARSLLVTHFDPKDPTAEAYRILRTNIEYLSYSRPLKTILLTSATMQEGKSTTISNLSIAFAQQGKKVLLLECNLRRPSLRRVFGIENRTGTSDILIQKARWQDCVNTVTDLALGGFAMEEILSIPGLDNLNIITYGHRPPNPTELLSSDRMTQLLAELREYYDMVVVDAPPLLPVADSMVLSTKVDGVVLVYMVGKAPRNSLRLAKERLETVKANVLGLALNDIRPETTGLTYSSYYMYAYGKDMDKRKRSAKPMPAAQSVARIL